MAHGIGCRATSLKRQANATTAAAAAAAAAAKPQVKARQGRNDNGTFTCGEVTANASSNTGCLCCCGGEAHYGNVAFEYDCTEPSNQFCLFNVKRADCEAFWSGPKYTTTSVNDTRPPDWSDDWKWNRRWCDERKQFEPGCEWRHLVGPDHPGLRVGVPLNASS